jgi:hypothetical protein
MHHPGAKTLGHRWPLVCTWSAPEFNVHVINARIRCPSGMAMRSNGIRPALVQRREALDLLLDVHGAIQFAIAKVRRVRLRFVLVLFGAPERSLFAGRR